MGERVFRGSRMPSMPQYEEGSEDCFLARLSWEDILFPRIIPLLDALDQFRLWETSLYFRDLMNCYFSRSKTLNLDARNINHEVFKTLTQFTTSFRVFRIRNASWLSDDMLRGIFPSNPGLNTLEISNCHHLTAKVIHSISLNCKQIKRLILKDCHWITKGSVEFLAHHLHGLEEINLTGCWELVDDTLIRLFSRCRRLEVISIANIYSLTDKTMRGLANFSPNLRSLDIRGCWRITDIGLNAVAEYCKHVWDLRVADCTNISEKSLERFRSKDVRVDKPLNPFYKFNTNLLFLQV